MARAAGMNEDEVEGLDEEFLYHLSRGSDLLGHGDAEAARASLGRALQLRPKDAKVLGLLGQALYKMGRFDQAAEVYARLVDDNPVESAARVNLGLACLKAKRYPEAVKQLSIALDLNPEHSRAQGYLGLAYFESGEIAKARECFAKAGKEQMVARCDEMLAGPRPPEPTPGAELAPAEVTPPEASPLPPPVRPAQPSTPAPSEAQDLAAFAASRELTAPAQGPFAASARNLSIAVQGVLLSRTDGLFAVRGALAFAPEMKHFRGRATDQTFGHGTERMHRVSGDGALFYLSEGRHFTALELGGEAAYLRDEVLFAFEDRITFENGRVPSEHGADLNLVHLRGPGKFLLVTRSDLMAVAVTGSAPVQTPLAALVGWTGALTPRILSQSGSAATSETPDPFSLVVELAGEGRVLLDPYLAVPTHGHHG